MNSNKGKNLVNRIWVLILSVMVLTSSIFAISYADVKGLNTIEPDGEVVNVGFPILHSVHEVGVNGEYRGYNYEYLKELAEYTDFKYNFIIGTWDECLKMMEEGKLDLLGFVSKTPEREAYLYYPELYAGKALVFLTSNENNTELSYRAYDKVNGKTLGILRGSSLEESFDKFVKEENIEVKKVYYDSGEEMKNDLSSGRIDLSLNTDFDKNADTQIVADFAVEPFYFAVSKNSPKGQRIFKKLDKAMTEMYIHSPNYISELTKNYANNVMKRSVNFTEGEKKFIESGKKINVVYSPDWPPLVFEDYKTGEPAGCSIAILEDIGRVTGLEFNYIKCRSYTEALSKIRNGEVDILVAFDRDLSWAEENNVKVTEHYLNLPVERVINESVDNNLIAIPKDYLSDYELARIVGDANIIFFDSPEECFEAVRIGEVRETYSNPYVANLLKNRRLYQDLQMIQVNGKSRQIALCISDRAPKELITIVKKATREVTEEEINHILLRATLAAEHKSIGTWMKNNPEMVVFIELLFCILGLVIMNAYVAGRRKKMKLLYTNSVTGTLNAKKFEIDSERLIGNLNHDKLDGDYVILHMDINKFRFINDIYGFEKGNVVLKIIAKVLEESKNEGEICATLWADHFVWLLKCRNKDELERRIKVAFHKMEDAVFERIGYRVVFRGGAYFLEKEDIAEKKDIYQLMEYANYALSTIEDSYKSQMVCFDKDIYTEISNARMVHTDIISAYHNEEFVPYFQPKYDIFTGEMIGVETLVRWIHPVEGIIRPDRFIPHLEKSGFVVEVDLHMFEETCKYLRKWQDAGNKDVIVSCNFSRRHIENPRFTDTLLEVIEKYGVEARYLEVELTETIAVDEIDKISGFIADIRSQGFNVSIDDFGSGYSSLGLLQQLQVDTIKLDKRFLKNGIPTDREKKIMYAIVSLAHQLDMEVICEGVETVEQIELLKSVDCRKAQGFYYAKPMSEQDFTKLLEKE